MFIPRFCAVPFNSCTWIECINSQSICHCLRQYWSNKATGPLGFCFHFEKLSIYVPEYIFLWELENLHTRRGIYKMENLIKLHVYFSTHESIVSAFCALQTYFILAKMRSKIVNHKVGIITIIMVVAKLRVANYHGQYTDWSKVDKDKVHGSKVDDGKVDTE